MTNTREWGPGVACNKPAVYEVTWASESPTRLCAGCAAFLRNVNAPMGRMRSIR